MAYPKRVQCSPLRREEHVADVVDVDVRADGQVIYSVLVEGHRYGVLAADAVDVDESR